MKKNGPGNRRKRRLIISCLCLITAFCTAYALMLPAITIPASASCGYEEHEHDESCYTKVLICDEEENHVHDESCYDGEGNLICTREEHHVHTESCYRSVLTCGKEEHTHVLQCYSNLNADTETATDWEDTLPEEEKEDLRENILQVAQSQLDYEQSDENFTVDADGNVEYYSRYGAFDQDAYGDWGVDFIRFISYYSGLSDTLSQEQKALHLRSQADDMDDMDAWISDLNKAEICVPITQARAGDLILISHQENREVQAASDPSKTETVQKTQIKAGIINGFDYTQEKVEAIMADWNGRVSKETFSLQDSHILAVIPLPVEESGKETDSESAKEQETTETEKTDSQESLEEKPDEQMESSGSETSSDEEKPEETAEETGSSDPDESDASSEEEDTDPEEDSDETSEEEDTDPEEDSDETSENKQVISKTAAASDGAVVEASYEEGVLPEDAVLTVKRVEPDTETYLDLESRIRESIGDEIDEDAEVTLSAYDLSFVQSDEETGSETELEPDGEVTVTIQLPQPVSNTDYTQNRLFHFTDEGELEDLSEEETTDYGDEEADTISTISFTGTSFSIYANATYSYNNGGSWASISTAQNLWDRLDNAPTNGTVTYLRLNNDIWNNNGNGDTTYTVKANTNVVLNMNGFCIERQGNEGQHQGVFVVESGATLTLTNSKTIEESAGGTSGGFSESTNNTYITYTGVNTGNPNSGTSQVKTVKNVSFVRSKTGTAIIVKSGGNLVLEKVAVMSLNSSNQVIANKPAITLASGSTARLVNSYVVNSYGGIQSSNATITMQGGAIANNSMEVSADGCVGAGINATGGTINLDNGAEVTNNSLLSWISRGGGIFISGGTLNLCTNGTSGNTCYISFNKAGSKANGYAAGGGVAAVENTTVNMKDGAYITGNTSDNIGGGMWCGDTGDSGNGSKLYMSGGYFGYNTAVNNEGGGLALSYHSKSIGIITGGTFDSNKTTTPEQWGGGGIFCAEGSYLYFPNGASIYNNHADGYGGGLASCSTGKIIIDNKVAVMNNTTGKEDGSHSLSGSSSDKTADREYVSNDKVFVERGANDIFGTSNTEIAATFPDGSGCSWYGSYDGYPLSNVSSGTILSEYLLGVTSKADESVKEANSGMPVQIINNSSTVHGGGVLINGIFLTDNPSVLYFGDSITLTASKQLVDVNGTKQDLSSYAGKFTFNVTDEKGTVVAVGTMDKTGTINFDRRLIFMPEDENDDTQTLTFYVTENSTGIGNITADSTKYKIVLSITKNTSVFVDDEALVNGAHIMITEHQYKISGATVYQVAANGSETQVTCKFEQPADINYAPSLDLTSSATSFTNILSDQKKITVQKNWDDGAENHVNDTISVTLVQTNTTTGESKDLQTVELNSKTDPAWYYDFGEQPTKDGNGEYSYSVRENTTLPGYISMITSTTGAGAGSASEVWVPISPSESLVNGQQYLIVGENANTALANNFQNNGSNYLTTSSKVALTENSTNTVNGTTYSHVYQNTGNLTYAIWTCNTNFKFNNYGSGNLIVFWNTTSNAYLRVEHGQYGLMFTDSTTMANHAGNFWKENNSNNLWGKSRSKGNSLIYYSESAGSFCASSEYTTYGTGNNQAAVLYKLVSTTGSSGGVTESFVITNRIAENVLYTINITKTDEIDPDMVVPNAVFTLSKNKDGTDPLSFLNESTGYFYTEDSSAQGAVTKVTSDRYGSIVLNGLPEGTYYLKEIKAPDGYETLSAPVEIVISPDTVNWNTLTYSATVENQRKKLSLPETGSLGRDFFIKGGAAILAISSTGLLLDERRRKRIKRE